MIPDQQKMKAKERVAAELKRYAAIALYLWAIFSVLELHRFVVLRVLHLASIRGYRIGFAAVNALIIGKFIATGEALHFGEQLSEKVLVYSVLRKSAMFAVLVTCLDIVEEVIVGMIHGKSFTASIPQLGGGGLEGIVLVGIIAFLVLIPLFLVTEVNNLVGYERLRSLFFQERSKRDAA